MQPGPKQILHVAFSGIAEAGKQVIPLAAVEEARNDAKPEKPNPTKPAAHQLEGNGRGTVWVGLRAAAEVGAPNMTQVMMTVLRQLHLLQLAANPIMLLFYTIIIFIDIDFP